MGNLIQRREREEKKKRYTFLGSAAIGLGAGALLAPWVGGVVLVGSAYAGWDWIKFRAKNGMKF